MRLRTSCLAVCLGILMCFSFACKFSKSSTSDDLSLKGTKLTPHGPVNVYMFAYSPITKVRPVGEDLCWYYAEVPLWGKKTTLERALATAKSLNGYSLYTKKIYETHKNDLLVNLASMASSMTSGAATCSASATGVGAVLAGAACIVSSITLITSSNTVSNSRKAIAITDKADVRQKVLTVDSGGIDALKNAVQKLKPEWNLDQQDKCSSADVVIREAKKNGQVFPGPG